MTVLCTLFSLVQLKREFSDAGHCKREPGQKGWNNCLVSSGSCLALLTCSLPSTGRELSQGILSDFAEKPQVLRLRLAPRTRQTPLRMTTLVGISTEPSCLIYAFSASAKDLRPALIAGLIRGVSGFGLFMRQLLVFNPCAAIEIPIEVCNNQASTKGSSHRIWCVISVAAGG